MEESTSTNTLGDGSSIPSTPRVIVTQTHDLRDRVDNAERELSVVRLKLSREVRKNRRSQQQINGYSEALTRTVHECNTVKYHFQLMSNSHLSLSRELEKAKIMVGTLEAVIQMLHTCPRQHEETILVKSEEQVAVDEEKESSCDFKL